MPSPKGDGTFKIPMPSIETPRFKFGEKQQGGMGQGDGGQGDPVDGQQGEDGQPGEGEAGDKEGNKELEVDLTLEELASILGEELSLPNIEPKGKKSLESTTNKYTSIGMNGPDSLKHFKRSYREALKRQMATGTYDAKNPIIVPIKSDMRFRSSQQKVENENSAVVIYMMDVSGSMVTSKKKLFVPKASGSIYGLRANIKILKFAILFMMQLRKKLMKKPSLELVKVVEH